MNAESDGRGRASLSPHQVTDPCDPSQGSSQIHSVEPLPLHRASPPALRQRSGRWHHFRPDAGSSWPYLPCATPRWCPPAWKYTTTSRRSSATSFSDSQPGNGRHPSTARGCPRRSLISGDPVDTNSSGTCSSSSVRGRAAHCSAALLGAFGVSTGYA